MSEKISEIVDTLLGEIDNVVHGKKEQVLLLLASYLAEGHVLLEDVPGTGKTVLAKSISKVLGLDFKRVQFTPDLLPSDVTGGMILDPVKRELALRKGPVFTSIFLGDEINRATPRTQAALLECMAERQVTLDGESHLLDEHFFVIATQNPIEQHGTFPLPEAQLDRFMIKIGLGVPDRKSEERMLKARMGSEPLSQIKRVLKRDDLSKLKKMLHQVRVEDSVLHYILDLVERSRHHHDVSIGGSPRATLALIKLGQALSLLEGRDYLKPSTIYSIFPHVIGHRLHLKAEARFGGKDVKAIVKEILSSVKTPLS